MQMLFISFYRRDGVLWSLCAWFMGAMVCNFGKYIAVLSDHNEISHIKNIKPTK
jgi:hypothetical protein